MSFLSTVLTVIPPWRLTDKLCSLAFGHQPYNHQYDALPARFSKARRYGYPHESIPLFKPPKTQHFIEFV